VWLAEVDPPCPKEVRRWNIFPGPGRNFWRGRERQSNARRFAIHQPRASLNDFPAPIGDLSRPRFLQVSTLRFDYSPLSRCLPSPKSPRYAIAREYGYEWIANGVVQERIAKLIDISRVAIH
jgi:hypothetical protein